MAIICITGALDQSIQLLSSDLNKCGMKTPQPLSRDISFDIFKWHDRVAAAMVDTPSRSDALPEPQAAPSRLWEQLAVDLVLANMDSPCWGWAHEGSVELLDFWAQLESSTRFVLVCEDSTSLICRFIESGKPLQTINLALNEWQKRQNSMVRFHLRNQDISVLVWSSEVQSRPAQIIQHILEVWNVGLDNLADLATHLEIPNPLVQQIAHQIQTEYPEAIALDHEIQALIGPYAFSDRQSPPSTEDLISHYSLIWERSEHIAETLILMKGYRAGEIVEIESIRLQLLNAEQAQQSANQQFIAEQQKLQNQLDEQSQQWLAELNIVQNSLALEKAAGLELLKQLDSEATAKSASETKSKELQEKSDLLLQQLHLVQEELEKQYLEHQEAQTLHKTEAAGKQDALKKIADEQAASADLKKQRDSEAAAKQDALKQLAAEKTSSADLKKQRDSEASAKTALETKAKDLQEESDLLLQQLHLVQEELENYYLKHKDQQHQVKQLQARWLRAVGKHPALQDFETLEIIQESESDNTTLWRINQLQSNGQVLGPFEFKTLIDNGVAGFVFSKDTQSQSPIMRWPVIAAKDKELAIIPVQGGDDPQKRTATILQLGTTDWYMVRQLTDILSKALSAADVKPQLHNAQTWLSGLQAQKQILDKVPALLRFDEVKFTGQQNTALKSVLGLQLSKADLQGLQTPQFEFQVQLNFSATGAVISTHLIFDNKTSGAPFEAWNSNVNSSGGQPVMAMMLSPSGWEPKLWQQLSPQDQQWLKNIVILLPTIWVSLQQQSTRLEKGWAHWTQAAADMRTWAQQVVLPPTSQTKAKADTAPALLTAPKAVPQKARTPRAAKKAPAKAQASPTVKAPRTTTKTAPDKTKASAKSITLVKPLPKQKATASVQTAVRPKKPSAAKKSMNVATPARRRAA